MQLIQLGIQPLHLIVNYRPSGSEHKYLSFVKPVAEIMDDDLIVVDDDPVPNGTQPIASTSQHPPQQEQTASGRPKRAAAARRFSTPGYDDILDGNTPSIGRATRSTARKLGGPTPKLKLKLNDKASIAPGMSFLGPYDRELDSDDEELGQTTFGALQLHCASALRPTLSDCLVVVAHDDERGVAFGFGTPFVKD